MARWALVDVKEARTVLGVAPGATWTQVRSAFRRLVRANHPDVAGETAGSGERVGRIIRAYAVLDDDRRRPPVTSKPVQDTLVVGAPHTEVLYRLLEAAHNLGEVTYVDRMNGIFEVVIEFEGWPTSSLLVTLRRRSDGVTEAACAIESLTNLPAPPVSAVAMLLRERLQQVPL